MRYLTSRIIFLASLIRILAAVAVVGAVAHGVYTAYSGLIVTGLIWVASAVTLGWVGNMIFKLVYVLISAAAGPSVHNPGNAKGGTATNIRYRSSHMAGARRSR